MKNALLRFLVSKSGSLLTPILATFVSYLVAKIALLDAALAESVNQAELTTFLVALTMSAVNFATNKKSSDGVKAIQAVVNVRQDGVPGPVTYAEVRRAIPVSKKRKR